jgi:hypothetical protein
MSLKEDIENKMGQDTLLSTIGWDSIKALITTALIITGFIKLFDLYNFFGYSSVAQIILIVGSTMFIYYKYFWLYTEQAHDPTLVTKRGDILTWKDFFYTTKISPDNQFVCLATSWVAGLIIYAIVAIIVYTAMFCFQNSGSSEVMSVLRVITIGVGASIFYIYTQRYNLKTNYWKIIATCMVYGFSLSCASYLLGLIIGISNMVLGMPITIAILLLQLAFTSIYTYIDLLEWSKMTHIVTVDTEPQPTIENIIKEVE